MTGLHHTALHLASRAAVRVQQAFRPATVASYRRKFRIFLAYCCFIQVQLCQLTPVVLLSFLEFLTENGISHSAIANYISAVKASLSMYNVSTLPFYDQRIAYFQKSLVLHKPFPANIKKIINIPLLTNIVAVCNTMWMGQVFKSLYLTAFFSFLRISNLVPHTVATFSPIEQLTRGDVFFAPPGVHLLIKWRKTMQMRDTVKILKLPALHNSPLCPVQALKNVFLLSPGNQDTPLFQVKNDRAQWVPLTDTKTRRKFHQILLRLGFQNSKISLHTFRRSGVTLAFNTNVSIQNIQSHGTWTSDCVWKYIVQDPNASQQVAEVFQSLLSVPSTTS